MGKKAYHDIKKFHQFKYTLEYTSRSWTTNMYTIKINFKQ